jgi:hypothetical protein
METPSKNSALFLQLVLMLQAAAMQHLGKLKHPESGAVERNLEAARSVIDMIDMIHVKTKGNLTEEETRLLSQVLQELRLNYVDEVQKDQQGTGTKE